MCIHSLIILTEMTDSQFYAKLKRVSWSNVITTYPKGSWERSKALAAISAISLRCGSPVEKSMHRCNTQQPWRCVAISTQWDVTASKMNCIPPNVDLKKFKRHKQKLSSQWAQYIKKSFGRWDASFNSFLNKWGSYLALPSWCLTQ